MTKPDEDDRLRERFAELRDQTAGSGRLPEFEVVLARARAQAGERPAFGLVAAGGPRARRGARERRRLLRAGAWATAALAATVTALLLTERRPRNDAEFLRIVSSYADDAAGGAWRSPTSGLLDVPGVELVRSLPQVGTPLRGLDPTTLSPRKASLPEENP